MKNFAEAYNNRDSLTHKELKDLQEVLKQLDRVIGLNPNYAEAYYIRGILKFCNLKDRSGAINDVKQAARLSQQQGNTQKYQYAIDIVKQLQQTKEN
jgi:tetratricopeptide (TPR) repeat protein